MIEFVTKRAAEFSLPLHETDGLVDNHCTEAGVLVQGSQIVVIRDDLANEVGAKINTRRTLRMEGATCSTCVKTCLQCTVLSFRKCELQTLQTTAECGAAADRAGQMHEDGTHGRC